MTPFELVKPDTLRAAVDMLDPEDPTIRVLSGGTALMLMMKTDVFHPTRLISLQDIEADYAEMRLLPDGRFRIGAMTTLARMEHDADLARFAPVIPRTMRTLSNVRVRNMATIGGALAHGDPHMDLPPVLMSLGAHVVTLGRTEDRTIPLEDLFVGYYETALSGDELIKEVIIPPQGDRLATYMKCTTRAMKDWPALGVALSLAMDGDTVRAPRLVIGSVSDRAMRVPEAEAALDGQPLTPDVMRAVAETTATSIETLPDELGSAAYKTQLVHVYVERALRAIVDQTNGGQ